jgi:hypothetical protein
MGSEACVTWLLLHGARAHLRFAVFARLVRVCVHRYTLTHKKHTPHTHRENCVSLTLTLTLCLSLSLCLSLYLSLSLSLSLSPKRIFNNSFYLLF